LQVNENITMAVNQKNILAAQLKGICAMAVAVATAACTNFKVLQACLVPDYCGPWSHLGWR
jgi:hypothetical protein